MNSPAHRASKKFLTASLTALLSLAGESQAAWMTTDNYNDPVIRQQHFDLGLSYLGTVVHLVRGTQIIASGVVLNNPRCILMAAHEFENGPGDTFEDPALVDFYIRTGPNYLTNPGSSVKISQIIRHPTRTAPHVGIDSVIAILESDLPGAIPATLAPAEPAVGEILELIGFGNQGTASFGNWGYITPTSGDIIGGRAPVNTIDSAIIRTRFVVNSTVPLIYNATPGDSGGGLFNAQRQLCGTLSQITGPTNNCSTLSVNLLTIAPWIQQVTAPYNPLPVLRIAHVDSAMRLTWDADATGFRLQTSDGLSGWTYLGSVLTGSGTLDDPIADRPSQFYRLTKP